ncbi:DUF4381 domain-containing protein [Vibrio tapetis subsp. quintayensis]|uniref:DUF4381 domain-containing protein n=1 Tax=Vibrio tapetis TaxID=52443 RepID=UPI0025B3D17A|nr:DUF4381 domain-containing protein [Vibrio tapetis]MDN3681894.1 DUF4381 domain-containing protein [Vibrio tapetis subsp. quintayensis]
MAVNSTQPVRTPPPLPLESLRLPLEPSAWPLAWGWWLIILATLGLIFALIYALYRREQKHRAKKQALRQFSTSTSVIEAHDLMRQAAMSYFPRHEIAALTGSLWYQFLDQQLKKPRFESKHNRWNDALYQSNSADPELIADAKQWISQALPPQRLKIKKNRGVTHA